MSRDNSNRTGLFVVAVLLVAALVVGVYLGRQTAPASSHTHSEPSLHYDCDGCLAELQSMALRLNEALANGTVSKAQPKPKAKPKPAGPKKPKKESP